MSDLNEVNLLGRLGQDPEIRTTQSGAKFATLSVATGEKWKDKNSGEAKERTEWHRVVIFTEGLAGVAEKYLRKGSRVFIRGRLATRKWEDKDGQTRYATEVVLQGFDAKLTMLDGTKAGVKPAEGPDDPGYAAAKSGERQPAQSTAAAIDDEIPF